MDFITQLPCTKSGHTCILNVVDRLSKRVHFIPTVNEVNAPQTAKLFFDHVVRLHGMPREIVSDRDPRFTSNFWRSLLELTGTKLAMSTSMHPQTDGQTERANRTLEEMLRGYVNAQLDDWDEHLTALEIAYNNTVQASTRQTPFMLDTGQHPNLPLDLLTPSKGKQTSATAEEFPQRMADNLSKAKEAIAKAQVRQQRSFNSRRRDTSFEEGDQVLVTSEAINPPGQDKKGAKLRPKQYGPYRIKKKISDLVYELQLPDTIGAHPTFNITKL
jgi:hypothetical protein